MPYSDNMYSMDDSDGEPITNSASSSDSPNEAPVLDANQQALSPSDGYFRGGGSSGAYVDASGPTASAWSGGAAPARSLHVPHVPDVWVQDPSLQQTSTAESKAREAGREEPSRNNTVLNTTAQQPSGDQPQPLPSWPASVSAPTSHHHPSHSPSHSRGTGASSRPSNPRYTPPPSSADARSSRSRSTSTYSERSSLIFPSEAPPAYTPSPTWTSPSQSRQEPARSNYRTFSPPDNIMGRREESQGLLADDPLHPQSMGDEADDAFSGVTPVWRERMRRRMPFFNWRNCRMILLGLVLLLVALGFLITTFTGTRDQMEGKPNDRVSRPNEPNEPSRPDNSEEPPQSYPAFDGDLAFTSTTCRGKKEEYPRQQYPLTFSPGHSFSFRQKIERDGSGSRRRHVNVAGDVVLRRNGAESSSLTVEMLSNSDSISVGLTYDEDLQEMVLTTPETVEGWSDLSSSPCLTIRVTVWVPGKGQLDTLAVDNVHLGIKLLNNLSIRVSESVSLKTTVGKISAATTGDDDNQELIHGDPPPFFALESRSIEVKTTSATIQGSWPLYDLLLLQSVSGNIAAGIVPKPADKDHPSTAAALFIKSVSGSLEFWEPVHQAQAAFTAALQPGDGQTTPTTAAETLLPPREYEVNVHTTSGTMSGALAFTRVARVEGISGSIAVDLLPVLPEQMAEEHHGGDPCDLSTQTTSGTTVLRVLKPLWVDDGARFVLAPTAPRLAAAAERSPAEDEAEHRRRMSERGVKSFLRVLHSKHSSTSAAIQLEYPGAWEGNIDLSAISGKLSVSGKGVKVIKAGDGWPGVNKHIVARKGDVGEDAGSLVKATSTSGHIKLNFPD